jgi:hypothetical protein
MSKKTIRIFAFENKEKKKKSTLLLIHKVPPHKIYSKVPESISNGAQYVTLQQ